MHDIADENLILPCLAGAYRRHIGYFRSHYRMPTDIIHHNAAAHRESTHYARASVRFLPFFAALLQPR